MDQDSKVYNKRNILFTVRIASQTTANARGYHTISKADTNPLHLKLVYQIGGDKKRRYENLKKPN